MIKIIMKTYVHIIYLVFLDLDLVVLILGQICVQVAQLMNGRGNDFEKIESMTMPGQRPLW